MFNPSNKETGRDGIMKTRGLFHVLNREQRSETGDLYLDQSGMTSKWKRVTKIESGTMVSALNTAVIRRHVSEKGIDDRILRLEEYMMNGALSGISISRVLKLDKKRKNVLKWCLKVGASNQPKISFTANSISGCLTKAEKFYEI